MVEIKAYFVIDKELRQHEQESECINPWNREHKVL
jgi:hypothetical protein